MSEVDLHIHTIASEDGEVAPREVLALAAATGLRAVAFADHDTTAAVGEGLEAAGGLGIDFVPGVEMTTLLGEIDVHILGYLLDWQDSDLLAACERTRAERFEQAAARVDRIRAFGFELDFDRVLEVAAGRPPTSAILMAVLKENYALRRDEKLAPYVEGDRSDSAALNFFLDWFTPGKPAYVPARAIDSADAIEIIRHAGGVPVMAHPGRGSLTTVEALIDRGILGIEVWSSNHTPADEAFYGRLAAERGLVATAGSDFHGPGRATAPLGALCGGGMELVRRLRARQESVCA